jgi:hypothetical protein
MYFLMTMFALILMAIKKYQKGDRTTIPKEWGRRRIYSQLDQASRGACEEAFQAPLFDEFVCALDVEFASQVRSTR